MASNAIQVDFRSGDRLTADIGTRMLVEPLGLGERFRTTLVGLERNRFLIVRAPNISGIVDILYVDKPVTVRFIHDGIAYGFESEVRWLMTAPYKLLFLASPNKVEILNLREAKRLQSFFPASLSLSNGDGVDHHYPGMITNISIGGCKAVVEVGSMNAKPQVRPNDTVTLDFKLFGSDTHMRIKGVIKSVNINRTRFHLGVMFHDIPDKIGNELEEYIATVAEFLDE